MDSNITTGVASSERSLQSSHPTRIPNLNGNSPRQRPQTLSPDQKNVGIPLLTLALTIHKDANGYGMKVSGDKPVFVESVKAGGAAQKAGLIAEDMILKVNGTHVRSSTHTNVVDLIKASDIVELTVQRSHSKMQRPTSSFSAMSSPAPLTPSTPVAQRNSITAPLPVDHAKRREMEFSKIHTLRLMLDQERKNLESLTASSLGNRQKNPEIARAEANIKKLQEELKQICGEDTSYNFQSANSSPLLQQTTTHNSSSTPAFLSRFPRSLSSLSLGTKKKSIDKEATSSPNTSMHSEAMSPTIAAHSGHPINVSSPSKKKHASDRQKSDIPPPLPQRNIPKKYHDSLDAVDTNARKNIVISDLDHSVVLTPANKNVNNVNAKSKKKSKSNNKCVDSSNKGDSSHMFLHMERKNHAIQAEPPPLPPRQPGLMEVSPNQFHNDNVFHNSNKTTDNNTRPVPNSINTLMNYPLITTTTPIRDNNISAAFPLSHRPNIVHQMQQHQQSTALSSQSQINPSLNKKHRRIVSSPENIGGKEYDPSVHKHQKSDSWDKGNEITPPGTPPPPYLSSSLLSSNSANCQFDSASSDLAIANSVLMTNQSLSAAQANVTQKPIISMEDEDGSDQENFIEEHGPFRSLSALLESENTAHLAVFLNFVLSNSDPSALLFYLITALYKEGSVKDMRKWAYEIHSTFLVPRAPLLWSNVDESLAREIDDVLQNEYDKVEMLRKVFWRTRTKAKEFITSQLQEFQVKRTAGLGTIYGPSDQQLQDTKGDKQKEQKIVEETLVPKLQQYLEDIDKEECPKKSALCSALSTVLQRFFITRSNPGSPIDKVHHFVSREKSFKSRLMGKNRKQNILGHNLQLQSYFEVTHCNHCQNILWGVSPQGYHCSNCDLNIHRTCSKVLEESCPGPTPAKNDSNKITKLMEKIRTSHHQSERKRHDEDGFDENFSFERPSVSITRQPSDRRQNNVSSNDSFLGNTSATSDLLGTSVDGDTFPQNLENDHFKESIKSKSAPVSVNRSESYKERSQKRARNRRKTSDPSLTKTTDEQNDSSALINSNYSSSSTSSLPLALDSRSASLEAVEPPPVNTSNTIITSNSSNTVTFLNTSNNVTAREWIDSEDEGTCELETDWSSNVDSETLTILSDAEKKRQEIINEIYQTERNHVRTLRLLEGIFMRPLQESGALNNEYLQLLFPSSLLALKDLHGSFESKLKQRRIEHGSIVKEIGDLLLCMFDGKSGDDLKEYAALFCARQQIALEALKDRRKKDENLQKILIKAESHKACRRLQLKDLLPTALQRLTKYPLLFDSLFKITLRVLPDNENEALAIKKALESSKKILNYVNSAVRIQEDAHKLQTIQKKLDKSGLEKDAPSEFKNIDLTVHKLTHDGPLIIKKNPGVQLHGLLFENMMVLLQKQDDKYLLKYHTSPGGGSGESKSIEGRFNPITKINLILVRQSAVDKNTFFLINTNVSQMLELTAPSSSECKAWFKHISEAADTYKTKTRGTPDVVAEDSSSINQSKDSFEAVTETNKLEQASSSVEKYKPDDLGKKDKTVTENEDNLRKEKSKQLHQENSVDSENSDPIHNTSNNSTRTLTQQCSLIAPTEIQISVNTTLTAEPVLTPSEKLRRLDESLKNILTEKQQIICDMYKVPNEHFKEIADIAGQPEAPKELSNIALAAYANVNYITEILNSHMKIEEFRQISAVSSSICDDCNMKAKLINSSIVVETESKEEKETTPHIEHVEKVDPVEDEDGYCEIEEIRSSLVNQEQEPEVINQEINASLEVASETVIESTVEEEHIEINNDDYDMYKEETIITRHDNFCGVNKLLHSSLSPAVPCHLINSYITELNSYMSLLLMKICERDTERDQQRREILQLRESLDALHQERVLESEKTIDEEVAEPEQSQTADD